MSAEKKGPVSNVGYYQPHKYHSMEPLHRKMNGIKRVVLFCMLTAVLPTILLVIPLYLRRTVYRDVVYALTESDVLEIKDGISPIFCSEHSLKMNETFNAFQVSRKPETTSYRKHIRLQKSMTLPDDTLEYWGFYLQKGATVALSVCSRFQGASILVVKGERNLRTCGMLDHNKNKAPTGIFMPRAKEQVRIMLDTHAQEINSKELPEKPDSSRRMRHVEKKRDENGDIKSKRYQLIRKLEEELAAVREDAAREEEEEKKEKRPRKKRDEALVNFYDQGIKHGGNNARNVSGVEDDSSISSFENGLLSCYNGQVLLSKEFDPSDQCMNVSYLMNGNHMQTIHEVFEDGYYYYIFYSDNDDVENDIHAVFDIYKPTLLYENVTKACVNQTECSFTLFMTSKDRVIVEVPTRDGIDHEIDDISLLKSVCHPRLGIYAVFPIAVMIFILGCAFV